MNIGIIKEPIHENRVVLLPEAVKELKKLGVSVLIESGAGERSFSSNQQYLEEGAEISDRKSVLSKSDLIISINPIEIQELADVKADVVLISAFNPLANHDYVNAILQKQLTSFSLDMIPRVTRGQAMDILSSMATVAGYRAVLDAAMRLPKFFPMFMTAAGTITPAKILILGAGVAGLQAVATSRKLGAQVFVFDVRPEVKEQVMSLGGKFVEVEGALSDVAAGGYAVEQTEDFKLRQQEAIHNQAIKSDVLICTAQIPGKKAPLLIKKETVEAMKPGSVIIDIAASTGGNCELTIDKETVMVNGVQIVGQSLYPSTMPMDASKMFGKNVINLLKLMVDKTGTLQLNFDDEIVAGCCITHKNEIINQRVKSLIIK
ncbi:MAG: Re/Si-specific NAD(P)(+) transhydrogenase subunit alpha [Bacteroidota bacterium]